ncbi:MAG: hypothetical protein M1830_009467 [Pleopsidium flavum]|nr:MAG: hypothetical protein M1830_009467 [Pleopsidium flavum]
MGYIRPGGHNWGPLNFDSLGVSYTVVMAVWSLVVVAGAWLMIHYRYLPFIRMRNLPLIISTVVSLHIYLVMVLLVYPLNGTFRCGAEYWIMSVWLPLGIAQFQVLMIQLLSVSGLQKRLGLPGSTAADPKTKPGIAGLWTRLQRMSVAQQAGLLTIVGMGVQLVCAFTIFFLSRKFHDFGVFAEKTSPGDCRRGSEWLPSIVWQYSWTFVYGPYVLYKIKDIQDIHYWKLQTILSIAASFPGSPLWLTAVYSDKFSTINKYWVAPMWFAPGLMTMEFVILFFPLLEVYQARKHRRSPVATISHWPQLLAHPQPTGSTNQPAPGPYSMAALNNALTGNSGQLLNFATFRDFSAENIRFLVRVAYFTDAWARAATTAASRRRLFRQAFDIYTDLVHPKLSMMPINIAGAMHVQLQRIFGPAANRLLNKVPRDVVAPLPFGGAGNAYLLSSFNTQPNQTIGPTASSSAHANTPVQPHVAGVPREFDGTVFDQTEHAIKQLVLTNTWRRYVALQ